MWRGRVLPLVGVGIILTLALLARDGWPALETYLKEQGSTGYAVFLGAFVGLTSVCFPVSALGFSAGLLYGPWIGLGLVFGGGLVSGSLMFLIGRVLFRSSIKGWVARNPKLAAVDRLAVDQALKLNIMARLSPLNYGLVCYTLASGRTGWWAYLGGLGAILPSMVAQTWLGSLARQTAQAATGGQTASRVEMAMIGVGLTFFLILSWQIGRMIRQAWQAAETDVDHE